MSVAIEKLEGAQAPVVAYLACTHYGYRRDLFSNAFSEAGIRAKVVNPNERAVGDLFGTRFDRRGESVRHDVEVEFVTRYAIPETTIEALTFFLSEISPRTVAAMQNFVQFPICSERGGADVLTSAGGGGREAGRRAAEVLGRDRPHHIALDCEISVRELVSKRHDLSVRG